MKIAILHYHLNPGGVTRIMGSQIEALLETQKKRDILVLCGNSRNQSVFFEVQVREDPALQYINPEVTDIDFFEESQKIKKFIKENANGFILHCHNPNLGKNPAFTLAIYQLALEGNFIVNHCHDFAEDRPGNMDVLNRMIRKTGIDERKIMYPDRPNYRYIVLNSCDYDRIAGSHISPQRVHLIPNPVARGNPENNHINRDLREKIAKQLDLDPGKKICTYPVRGIKRKNLGEFILLAVIFRDSFQFVITQPPLNPEELPGYVKWKEFCWALNIGIKFEAGDIVNHEDLIGISDFCITTSEREGFGMVYLEPWLAGTPVSGRDLPCISADLRKYGLEFPGLYDGINVKMGKWQGDFKDLGPKDQREFITRILGSQAEKNLFVRMNPLLENLFAVVSPRIMEKNRQIIMNHFSVSNYGKRLFALYKSFPG